MNSICARCQAAFPITDKDREFYKINQIPEPTHCPDCRFQRRYAWRNERTLYWRKCSGTGQNMLSVFDSDAPFPVYDVDYWYSDAWDARSLGRDFDFNRPFFDQFMELYHQAPQVARSVVGNENCDYINQAGWNRNCYLIYEANYAEDCYYSSNIQSCKDCLDCFRAYDCQLCYECVNCERCYQVMFAEDCMGCSESWFLKSCIGCKNCFGCVNLRNKEYHFFNEPCTPEEYARKVAEVGFGKEVSSDQIQEMRQRFKDFRLQFPHKYMQSRQAENCTGDYLSNCQNCDECYGLWNSQDCKWVVDSRNMKNVYDVTVFGAESGIEFCCDSHEVGDGCRNIYYSCQVWSGCYDIYYSQLCLQNSHHLFGCVSLKHQNYCILNKQYSPEDYEVMKARIIEHMKKTGEWGEFFPAKLSPWAYNESMALPHYPLSREETLAQGFKWKEVPVSVGAASVVPDFISQVDDSIVDQTLSCEVTRRPYKLIKKELAFYRRFGLPIPRRHSDQRHEERRLQTLPRHLWNRPCNLCQKPLRSPYAPNRPETVVCEECYLKTVY